MKISKEGLELLKRLEGLRLKAYQCDAGVWTIGYGSTGDDVYEGLEITEEEAEKLLLKDLKRFERAVNKEFPNGIKQNKFDAFVIFAFNIGVSGFKESTALRKAKEGASVYDVVFWMKKWVYVNGVRNKGLVKRRNAESCVYMASDYRKWV